VKQGRATLRHKLLLLAASIVFSLLLLELLLQGASFALRAVSDHSRTDFLASSSADEYRILCLGESTTEGYGQTSYPSILAEALEGRYALPRFEVINAGFVAETSSVLVRKLGPLISQYRPRMVIVMMGINDPFYFSNPDRIGLSTATQSALLKSRVYKLARIAWSNLAARFSEARPHAAYYPTVSPDIEEHYNRFTQLYWDYCDDWNEDRPHDIDEKFRSLIMMAREVALSPRAAKGAIIDIPEPYIIYYYGSYEFLSAYYVESDRQDEAIALFNEAIDRHPEAEFFLRGLGGVYAAIGDDSLGRRYFRQADQIAGKRVLGVTKASFTELLRLAESNRMLLVAMQYPTRKVTELKYLLDGSEYPLYVDNELTFIRAVEESGYDTYFADRFAGNFGHCTEQGNRLIVENLLNQVFDPLFGPPSVSEAEKPENGGAGGVPPSR
jgi:lysophospholipase L1-like esterase